ncbi:hypothetical protein EDC94DRAFT_496553, partial [Helicostylum pulchrum]
NIVEYRDHYQEYIRKLKQEEYSIIRYARKSEGPIDGNRIRLLQLMCERLREISLVEKVFVSVCSNAILPIYERD